MSALLDAEARLDTQRAADLDRNDAAIFPLQAKSEGLRFYVVTFGPRKSPRLSYVVMAKSSAEAWASEIGERIGDERMEVLPADSEPFPVQVVRHELECKELAAVAADVARNVDKGPRLARINDQHAMDLQVQFQGFIGGLV